MNTPLPLPRPAVHAMKALDPRLLLRASYVGRVAITLAIFFAVGFVFQDSAPEDRLIATALLVAAAVFTAISAAWSEFQPGSLNDRFLGGQILFDLVLVTGLVHVTGGAASQFGALYILVIAVAALMLTASAGLFVAALGCVFYFADVILAHRSSLDLGYWLQLGVFAGVALSSGYIASRLREARAGREELAAELVKVRLQAEDILRNIRSGIVTVDAAGYLVYANPAASSLLGMDLSSKAGRRVRDLFGSISPELVSALEQAAGSGIRTVRAEGKVITASRGFPIGLNTTITASHEQNGSDNANETSRTATAIFQDLTDQKRLDALRRRTQRLEAVTELSASLAHEIKNPLASIRSAVEQLSHSTHATPDERTLSSLIVRESDRLARLLSEFLDFARVRVNRIQKIDIGRLTRGAATLAATHPSCAEHVRVSITGEAGVIEGDDDVLHRAVFNLVLNAVQMSPVGGEVRVEVSTLRADDAPPGVRLQGGGVTIRISDRGPGIPPDVREKIFDPFFTTRPGGSGLGLAVVHRAVESHSGFVFVDTEVGNGTKVTVLLPRDHDHPADEGK
ncbi:MAG TPA: ATP-binding protein [Gemmatimonadaceae bacterium]|nr:ATP-binding protein [Gemmatimonadaceae bacterium]